jgi:hypothetical protein
MKPSEIIKVAAQNKGLNPSGAVQLIHQKILQDHVAPLQYHNSLMILKPLGHGAAAVSFITADSHLNFIRAVAHFKTLLMQDGIHQIFVNNKDHNLLNALETVGIHMQISHVRSYRYMAHI